MILQPVVILCDFSPLIRECERISIDYIFIQYRKAMKNNNQSVSFHVALHLAQMKRSGRFQMFDYGSERANAEMYDEPEPFDLGECFSLIDIPVDLVAGRKDKVIRPSMVKKHYKMMKEANVDVSYNEFEYAHLDFTFSHREELLAYVMSRLLIEQKPSSLKKME